jgi:tetratricopeptide (TPR) repeat protein
MAISDQDIELIERYLSGELDSKEEETVEERIKTDKEFAEELDFMRDVMSASQKEGREEFREKLSAIGKGLFENLENKADTEMKENSDSVKKLPLHRRRLIYYASALAAAIIVGIFIFLPGNRTGKLYSAYYEPYPNEIVPYTRGEEVPRDFSHFPQEKYNLIVRAMKHYERGNYEKAARLFENNVVKIQENAGLLLYMGISQMETGKEEKAIENFKYIISLTNPPLKKQAEWYLALSYLKTNKTEKAKTLLNKIKSEPNHPHMNEAEMILEKMD